MTREDGKLLIDQGAGNRGSIFASMQWDIPAADGSLVYTVWTHSNDENAAGFRAGWEPYIPYLGAQAKFTPKMFIWDGINIGCGR